MFGQLMGYAQHGEPNMRIFAQDRACCHKIRVDIGEHPEAARRFEPRQRVGRPNGHGLTLAASLTLLGLP